MRISIFLFFQITYCSTVEAQNSAVAVYHADLSGPFEAKFSLLINGAESLYQHLQNPDETVNEKGWNFYQYKDYIYWYHDSRTNSIVEQRLMNGYPTLIAEWVEEMDWTITDQKKTILGYSVQKATRKALDLTPEEEWKQGDVIAWFAVDLPFSSGPERYYGLPGLILELSYTKSSEKFTLEEISFQEALEIKPPTEGIKVTKEQIFNPYYRIDKKWLKNERKRLNIEIN
ncbi:MAG: GLPGLI family protein [Bacteroidota bacterium]